MESSERELLENVTIASDESGSQYMIQRMSVDNAQLLSSDLLQHHNGLVVDLGGDFIPVNYSSEDLLSQDLTEEDRNLAATLLAVQFNQQQKQQQNQQDNSVIINSALPSLVATTTLDGKVTLSDQQVILQDKQTGYFQIVDADNLYKQTDCTQYEGGHATVNIIKTEVDENDGSVSLRDSDDNRDLRSAKKSLPHKKRISRKLKKNEKIIAKKMIRCNLCEQVVNADVITEHQQLCQTTTITPIVPNPFSCQICNSRFADQLVFFEHLKSHYEPPTSSQGGELVEHGDEEEEQQVSNDAIEVVSFKVDPEANKDALLTSLLQLVCVQCNKSFRRHRTYEQHMKEFHSINKEEEPEADGIDEFSEPEDLMAGIDVHAGGEVDDDHDDKAWYHREDELQATEEDLKEIEAKDHVCQNCQQPFPVRAILLQHLVNCRSTAKPAKLTKEEIKKKRANKKTELECTICERKFTHRNSLVYHMRSHTGIRPHQCEQCGKSFFAASALKVHLRLHSGDKPYRCEFCGRNFRQWGDLKYHCISIHSDEKQYQCEYCGKDFARKYSLIVHRRIHTGEKNYRCEFCGKTFRASSYLQNHRRIHTGEKPHPCEVCGKRFRVRSDMKRHLRTHTRRKGARGPTINPPLTGDDLKLEEVEMLQSEVDIADEDEDDVAVAGSAGDVMLKDESDVAVQSLHYEQETLETVDRDGTLYVMPILIS